MWIENRTAKLYQATKDTKKKKDIQNNNKKGHCIVYLFLMSFYNF